MGMTQSKQEEEQVITPETSAANTLEAIKDKNDDDDDDDSSDEEDEEQDEEFEEFMKERLRILEDSKNLKKVAEFFLHPEKPVEVDATTFGRNYFARPAAPEYEDDEDDEERDRIMEDLAALKKYATFYLKPELPVATDATAFGRNYFTRPSATEKETFYKAEQRALVLKEMAEMKKYVDFYRHPERPVVTSDPTACGRNFFTRPSAPVYEDYEESEERQRIMEDMKMLKQNAGFYTHPEVPLVTSDPAACGRNYFTRASAPEYEDDNDVEEREQIMEDVKMLKRNAEFFMHPEKPVAVDPTVFGRNYFSRASAESKDTFFEAEQRNIILEEMKLAKKLATDYLHPEVPLVTSDPTVLGRNYFTRPAAPEQVDNAEEEEKNRILEEMKLAKKLATDYLHPELPVVTSDPTVFGRDYFSRLSAPEPLAMEEEEEKHRILADLKLAKKLATDFLHPEIPLDTSDPTLCARSYFSRPSVYEQEDAELSKERALILDELAQMKKVAIDYYHPELPVDTSDSTAFGRNFFMRASAPEQEEDEVDEDERAIILEELAELKKLAFDFDHPELLITSSDPTSCGRNYFYHDAAPGLNEFVHPVDDDDDDESSDDDDDDDLCFHHAHFDMDDDIHLHHVDFDKNADYHAAITEVRHVVSGFVGQPSHAPKPKEDDDDEEGKLSSSPECVMFAHFKQPHQVV